MNNKPILGGLDVKENLYPVRVFKKLRTNKKAFYLGDKPHLLKLAVNDVTFSDSYAPREKDRLGVAVGRNRRESRLLC